MKTITANSTIQKNKKYDVEPVNLLVIEFGGVVGTKYYSDRPITIYDADGALAETYEAVVADWGSIDGIIEDIASANDFRVTLVNSSSSPISDLFSLVPPEGTIAKLYQWFDATGMTYEDKILLFNGKIASPVNFDLDKVEFDIVDRTLDIESKLGTEINKTDYPKALDAHIGRIIPQVFGYVLDVPAVCVYTAGRSALSDTISNIDINIVVDDGSVFPTDAVFVLIVEDEEIRVPIGGASGNTFSGCTRGYNGTVAVLHLKGVEVYEQLSQFRYAVHDGRAYSISSVRLLGHLLTLGNDYTLDQDNYPGEIIFTEYPSIGEESETNLNDYEPDAVPAFSGTPIGGNIGSLIDGDSSNFVTLRSGLSAEAQRTVSVDNGETFKRVFLVVKYKTNEEWDSNVKLYAYFDNNNLGQLTQPIFTPEQLEELELARDFVPEDTKPVIFKPPSFSSPNDASPNKSRSSKVETETVFALATTVALETIGSITTEDQWQFEPNKTGGGTFDLSRIVSNSLFAQGPDNIIDNWQSVVLVATGFEWDKPSGDGWFLKDAVLNWNENLAPGGAYTELDKVIINGSRWTTNKSTIFVDELFIDETRLSVRPSITVNSGMTTFHTSTVALDGYVSNVRVKLVFERQVENDIPPIVEEPPVVTPPPLVPNVFSDELEKIFEITTSHGVSNTADLLNKSFGIRFTESSDDLPELEVYLTSCLLRIETGAYTFKYEDRLTADVQGYYVDGTDITTDYGLLNSLVTRPDRVMKLLLTHSTWGSLFSLSDINLTKYNVAGTFYTEHGYQFDFASVEATTLRQMLSELAFQVRSDQYWEDGIHVLKVLRPDQTALKTLDTSNTSNISFNRSSVDEIINLIEIRYNFNHASLVDFTPNKYKGIVKVQDIGSQAIFGIRRDVNEKFLFDKVKLEFVVQHVSMYYIGYRSRIKTVLIATCFLDQIELQKHDIVNVTWPLGGLTAEPCRVLDMKLDLGNKSKIDQIEITLLREDYTYTQSELSNNSTVSDSVVIAPRKGLLLSESPGVSDSINVGSTKYLYESVSIDHLPIFRRDFGINIFDSPAWGSRGWGNVPWGSNISIYVGDALSINGTEQEVVGAYGLKLKDFSAVISHETYMLGSKGSKDRDSSEMIAVVTDYIEISKY